jgi:antirestriction protein ArdC
MSNQTKIYEKVNDIVIEGLKKEGLNWFKPWGDGQQDAPFNLHTNRFYNGFNIFMLNAVMKRDGFEFNQWLTFKQVSEKGGKIIKGSKSTDVYYWNIGYFDLKLNKYIPSKMIKSININEKYGNEDRYKKTFSLKFYKVFNVGQCENIEPKKIDKIISDVTIEPNEVADNLVKNYVESQNGFKITHKLSRAFYNPSKDFVNMPKLETFVDSDSYYKVLFHELAHSTGHKSRLNRKTLTEIAKWGDNTYAKEELVAEISAMYLVGLLGLDPKDNDSNSQAYIKGWCKYLSDKPKECLSAMQQATKAVDLIRG